MALIKLQDTTFYVAALRLGSWKVITRQARKVIVVTFKYFFFSHAKLRNSLQEVMHRS
jgi:hypothetical protein